MDSIFFVDFLWKLLIVLAIASSFIMGSFLIARGLFSRLSGSLYNRMAQFSSASLLTLTVVAAIVLWLADQDLQARCFGAFVNQQGGLSVTRILAVIWLSVTGGLLGFDGLRCLFFLKSLNKKLLRKEEKYWVTCDGTSALSFGFVRGVIVIPEYITKNPVQLAHVLEHERTHLRNHDGVWALLALLVNRICWFQPLTYVFERNRVLAMEMFTDEETIHRNKLEPLAYAESLLKSLSQGVSSHQTPFVMNASAQFEQLRFRLESLRCLQNSTTSVLRKWLAVILLVGGWSFGLSEALASIRIGSTNTTNEVMCYQVHHEKVIENWLHIKTETNKCE